ncbi:MAG: hypothetical protein RSC98_05530, partial [Clostridia bacterium]
MIQTDVSPCDEQGLEPSFLQTLRERIALPEKYRIPMIEDFEKALRYYRAHGLSSAEATARLDPAQLGDFYLKERTDWYPLDTAAKIYPLSIGTRRMMMFRLSCYLKEP